MNRFSTIETGGLPLWSNDFRWFDTAYREAFKAIMKGLIGAKPDYAILEGCIFSQDPGNEELLLVSEGFIYNNAEIYYVPEHSFQKPSIGETAYFAVDVTWDAEGLKTFEDTVPHNTYEIRRARVVISAAPPAGHMPATADDLITILASRLGQINKAWTLIKLTDENVHISAGGLTGVAGWLKYITDGHTAHVAIDLSLTVTTSEGDAQAPGNLISVDIPAALTADTTILHHNQLLTDTLLKAQQFKLFTWTGAKLYISATPSNQAIQQGYYYFRGIITYELASASYSAEPYLPAPVPGGANLEMQLLIDAYSTGEEGEVFTLPQKVVGSVLVLLQGSAVSPARYTFTQPVDGFDTVKFTFQLSENDQVLIYGLTR